MKTYKQSIKIIFVMLITANIISTAFTEEENTP